MKTAKLTDSEYLVATGKVLQTRQMTKIEKLFEISLPEGESLDHEPGQFVMVSIPGVGEAPFSISSSPTKRSSFEIVVRSVGKVTNVLHKLETGDKVGIRGPFGKGFPVHLLEGNDLLFVAGGLGIVPLRSLIKFVIENRRDFGKVTILLGCKTPQDMLFGEEVSSWSKRLDVSFDSTVDRCEDAGYKGNIGLITKLIPGVTIDPGHTFAAVIGPPIMYKFVITELLEKKIPERQILVSLERHMKCGVGKCGHCQIQNYYCCKDGPVFTYEQLKNIREAL